MHSETPSLSGIPKTLTCRETITRVNAKLDSNLGEPHINANYRSICSNNKTSLPDRLYLAGHGRLVDMAMGMQAVGMQELMVDLTEVKPHLIPLGLTVEFQSP
jgi:hypothetical protein